MQSELLTISQAAEILGMSKKRARLFLNEHGLHPFDVCTSDAKRRKVLRWSLLAVRALIDTLQAGAETPCADTIPRRKDSIRIVGRSPKEVFAMYAR